MLAVRIIPHALFFMRASLIYFVFCFGVWAVLPLGGQVIQWDGGDSGLFSDGANWVGGTPPGPGNEARFAEAGDVEVTFTAAGSTTVETVDFAGTELGGEPAGLFFDLEDHTFATQGSLLFDGSNNDARIFVAEGGVLNIGSTPGVGTLGVNNTSNVRQAMTVELKGGIEVTIGNQLGIGRRSVGILEISEGSVVTIDDQTLMGHGQDGNGRMTVTGAGSEFRQEGGGSNNRNILVGFHANNGQGTLEVLDGGKVTTVRSVTAATVSGTTGTVLVSGAGSNITATVAGEGLVVGGRTNSGGLAGGTATATFSNGGSGDFDLLRVFANDPSSNEVGTLVLDGSGGVRANTALLQEGSIFRMTLNDVSQAADLEVSGLLTLGNAHLEVLKGTGFSALENDVIQIVEFGSLSGTFQGLADGSAFWVGNTPFEIHYGTLQSDFITLTVIPEPGVVVLIGFGLASLLGLRHRRSTRCLVRL